MFTQQERALIGQTFLFWHQRKWQVHALTVMPEHAHILATPLESRPWEWYSLAEILHSIKRRTSRRVNTGRGWRGMPWQEERHDRIMRGSREYEEKFNYILQNAVRRGLCTDPFDWDGLWCESMDPLSVARLPVAGGDDDGHHVGTRVPYDVVVRTQRDLPHWELGGSTYFITFRVVERRLKQAGWRTAG